MERRWLAASGMKGCPTYNESNGVILAERVEVPINNRLICGKSSDCNYTPFFNSGTFPLKI